MKFMCPHCGTTAFRLLSGADGKPAAECLNCGKASTFDQSTLPDQALPPEAPEPSNLNKRQRRSGVTGS